MTIHFIKKSRRAKQNEAKQTTTRWRECEEKKMVKDDEDKNIFETILKRESQTGE